MTTKQILITIASVITIFGFLFGVYTFTNKPAQTSFPEVNKLSQNDHLKWSKDKKIVLVEYSDLQCPACKLFHGIIKDMEKSQNKDVQNMLKKTTFIYRHFPLVNVHQHALQASYAAEAAGNQGKFFEMVDKMFTNQDTWSKSPNPLETFVTYAGELKLDLEKFKKDMDSSNVKAKVQRDITSGNQAQVQATPTFYLNGNKVVVNSFPEFQNMLAETVKNSK